MIIRRLNNKGIEYLKELVLSAKGRNDVEYDKDVLTAPETTDALVDKIKIDQKLFKNRLEVGKNMFELLSQSEQGHAIEVDQGVWAWLALFYFNQLCKNKNGKLLPGSIERWIPMDFRAKHYRHLLAGPYYVYKKHRKNIEKAMIALYKEPNEPGELYEQLCGRQEILRNQNILEVATILYYDNEKSTHKRGSASKNIGGTSRRFGLICGQLEMTWDLYSITTESFLQLLPREFNRFIN